MLHEIIWQQNVRLADVCLHHPFVRGLADGTLDPEAFRRYVAQDALIQRQLGQFSGSEVRTNQRYWAREL
jgi:thiaminase